MKYLKYIMSELFYDTIMFAIKFNFKPLYLLVFRIGLYFHDRNVTIQSIKHKGSLYYKLFDKINKLEAFFQNPETGVRTYYKGIYKRAIKIGEEVYMLNKIDFNKDDIVYDVGSNLGVLNLYFYLKNSIFQVKYFSFEPGKSEFESQRLNSKIEGNIFFNNYGLGDKKQEMTFYYKPDNGDSSFIEMKDYDFSYKVKVERLDNVINSYHHKKIKLLKIETEGFEPEVLNGLGDKSKIVEYIVVDCGFERGINQESTAANVINYLYSKNFSLLSKSKTRDVFLFKNKSFKN